MDAAAITKPGSCHLFRHTMVTMMLENGADIRYIQVMLGHSSLSATEIYTQVSILKLKEIHTATHPARLQRRGGDNASAVRAEAGDARVELLHALAMEDEDATGHASPS